MAGRLINGREFLHIPKTGGDWVAKMLRDMKLIKTAFGHKHSNYDHAIHFECPPCPARFCFVRNPLDWYSSYYRFTQPHGGGGWGEAGTKQGWHVTTVLNNTGNLCFEDWLMTVLKRRPGFLTWLYHSYTRPGITYIGKNEHLREHLIYILDDMGLKYDGGLIQYSKRLNVSGPKPESVNYTPELRDMVIRCELGAMIHYDYLTEKDAQRLGVNLKDAIHPSLILK